MSGTNELRYRKHVPQSLKCNKYRNVKEEETWVEEEKKEEQDKEESECFLRFI